MIDAIEMFNCGPFLGHHEVAIGPGAYAVTATHDEDPRRSNAIGKSFLLEAVCYALTGRWRRERAFDVDGWVSRGEREGRTVLHLDGGATVERWKILGQSRQLRVTLPGTGEAAQDDAQLALEKWLGFDAEDFKSGAYFEQRSTARLLHMDPGERLKVVTGWLGLSAGARAEQAAIDLASEAGRDHEIAAAKVEALRSIAAGDGKPANPDELDIKAAEIRKQRVDVGAKLAKARARTAAQKVVDDQAERATRARRARDQAAEDHVLAAGATKAAAKVATLSIAFVTAKDEAKRRRKVALGLFDGRCPIASIECPAKDEINANREAATTASAMAEEALQDAERAVQTASEEAYPMIEAEKAERAANAVLESVKAEMRRELEAVQTARKVLDAGDDPGNVAELNAEGERLDREVYAIERDAIEARREIDRRAKAATDLLRAEEVAKRHALRQRRAMAARACIRTAQRRIGEEALGRVEADANDAIADAGIDLQVRARWERDGKGPARACDTCGAAFPASAKVKQCERCGSPRGVLTEQRLDLVPSDSSGAYDDLAGAAWQLAAGAWLLEHRGSPWACAMLDEPFAHADQVVRRGLARCLLRAVAGGGAYRQLIVVSHTGDTVDMMPGRIEIRCAADGQRRIEVRAP